MAADPELAAFFEKTKQGETMFNKGDTVRLKSGGPLMTVLIDKEVSGHKVYSVVWFDENSQVRTESFPPYVLRSAAT